MNKKVLILLLLIFTGLFAVSCERYPLSSLKTLPGPKTGWPSPWYIYDDEINTKGNPVPYAWSDDGGDGMYKTWKLFTNCGEHPKSGISCMQMIWTGNGSMDCYAGFGLMTSQNSGEKKDMRESGYKRLKFWIRGSLEPNCKLKIEIPNPTNNKDCFEFNSNSIPSEWSECAITITDRTKKYWNNQEYYISVTLSNDGTGLVTYGGTVYLDDIRFER